MAQIVMLYLDYSPFFSSFLIISGSKEKDADDREDCEIEGGS